MYATVFASAQNGSALLCFDWHACMYMLAVINFLHVIRQLYDNYVMSHTQVTNDGHTISEMCMGGAYRGAGGILLSYAVSL